MIKNEQLKEWGWKLEKKKSNKILRDKIEKKKRRTNQEKD